MRSRSDERRLTTGDELLYALNRLSIVQSVVAFGNAEGHNVSYIDNSANVILFVFRLFRSMNETDEIQLIPNTVDYARFDAFDPQGVWLSAAWYFGSMVFRVFRSESQNAKHKGMERFYAAAGQSAKASTDLRIPKHKTATAFGIS